MSYSSTVLADSPLVYLRLGDASGSTATDSSGNSHNGTYQNSPTLGATGLLTGDSDTAVTLNGTNQYVSIAGGSWMAVTDYTVECWVKFTNSATEVLLCWATGSGASNRIVELSNLSNLLNAVFYNTGGTGTNVAAGSSSNDGNRHHVVIVKSGTALALWIDNVQVATATATVRGGSSAEFDIGRRNGGTFFTAGTFDELAIYGSALSSTRIAAHYSAGVDTIVTPPAGAATAAATAPTIAAGASLGIPASAAIAASTAPAISSGVNVTVPAAAATADATAPGIAAGLEVDPPAAAAIAAAAAPNITAGSSSSSDVAPPAAAATADATSPEISAGANTGTPAAAATADATSPAIAAGVNIAVPAAAATADATPPVITTTSDVTLALPLLTLTLAPFAPSITTNVTIGLPALKMRLAAPAVRLASFNPADPVQYPSPDPLDTVIGTLYDRDGVTRIDRLPNIDAAAWREVMSRKGSASFQVPLDDDTTSEITDRRVVKLAWVRGGQIVAKFACRIRAEGSKVKQLAVDGRRWVRFENMPGVLDFLSDDVIWPSQPLDETDAATRWFGFMSPEDDWYVPEDWGTPQGQAWSDTGSTFRDKLPTDFRGVDQSAEWISTIAPTTTQPEFNFNYFRGSLHLDVDTQVEILYTVDNFLWFHIDGDLAVNVPPPGRGQWRTGYTLNTQLTMGDHLFAAKVQNSRFSLVQGANPIAFIMTVRALNSDGSVNKDHPNAIDTKGVLFRSDTTNWLAHPDEPEPGWHRAQLLLTVIDEGKSHSAGDPTGNGLTYIKLGFTGEHDSDGQAWTDRGSYEMDIGTQDLAAVVAKLSDRFVNFRVDPDDMRLHAYKRLGSDRTAEIQLRYGWDPDQPGTILEAEIDAKGVQYNSVLTQLPINRWMQTDRDDSIANVGRVTAGINAAPLGTLGSGGFVADRLLDEGAAKLSAITVKSSTLEGQLPYVDYDLGDTITIPGARGAATPHRALALNVVGPTKDQPTVQAWGEFMEDQSA